MDHIPLWRGRWRWLWRGGAGPTRYLYCKVSHELILWSFIIVTPPRWGPVFDCRSHWCQVLHNKYLRLTKAEACMNGKTQRRNLEIAPWPSWADHINSVSMIGKGVINLCSKTQKMHIMTFQVKDFREIHFKSKKLFIVACWFRIQTKKKTGKEPTYSVGVPTQHKEAENHNK
jgi:hypothetical protein